MGRNLPGPLKQLASRVAMTGARDISEVRATLGVDCGHALIEACENLLAHDEDSRVRYDRVSTFVTLERLEVLLAELRAVYYGSTCLTSPFLHLHEKLYRLSQTVNERAIEQGLSWERLWRTLKSTWLDCESFKESTASSLFAATRDLLKLADLEDT